MKKSLFGKAGLGLIAIFLAVACQPPNAAQDVGDIDRTQPNKVEKSDIADPGPGDDFTTGINLETDSTKNSVWDIPSNPD